MRQRMRLASALPAILTMALMGTSWAAHDREARSENPWEHVVHSEQGQVLAASGRDANHSPIWLTVGSANPGDRFQRTTTYVNGRRSLQIARVYDDSGVLRLDYNAEGENLSVSVHRDEPTGEALAFYTMPDGRTFTLWADRNGRPISGDLEGLRHALRGEGRLLAIARSYARDAEALGGAVAESGRIFQLRVPDAACLDACAKDCTLQCAFECLFGYIACDLCKVSCAVGCSIGCSA